MGAHTSAKLSLASLLILTIGIFLQLGHYHSKNGIVIEYKRSGVGSSQAYSAKNLKALRKQRIETKDWLGTEDGKDDTTVAYDDAVCKHGQGGDSIESFKAARALMAATGATGTATNPCGIDATKLGVVKGEAQAGCGFAAGIAADTSMQAASLRDVTDDTTAAKASLTLQSWPYSCVILTEAEIKAAHRKAHNRATGMVHECSTRANGGPMNSDDKGISLLVSPSELSIKHIDGCKAGFDTQDEVNQDDAYCDILHIPTPKEMSNMRFINTQLQQLLPCPVKNVLGAITGDPDCPIDINKDYDGFAVGPNRNKHSYEACSSERFDSDSCDNAARFLKDQAAAIALIMALLALSCKAFSLLIFVAEDDQLQFNGYNLSNVESGGNVFAGSGRLEACMSWTADVLSWLYAAFTLGAFITQIITMTTMSAFTDSGGECVGKYLRDLGYHESQTFSAGYVTCSIFVTIAYAIACVSEVINVIKHGMAEDK